MTGCPLRTLIQPRSAFEDDDRQISRQTESSVHLRKAFKHLSVKEVASLDKTTLNVLASINQQEALYAREITLSLRQ